MPSYRLIGAASGRMGCSTPNLQNIPRDAGLSALHSSPCGTRPRQGRLLADRVAHRRPDLGRSAMQAAFRAGEDLHTKTARAVLGANRRKHDRQLAKALNFGLLYGMGASGCGTTPRTTTA